MAIVLLRRFVVLHRIAIAHPIAVRAVAILDRFFGRLLRAFLLLAPGTFRSVLELAEIVFFFDFFVFGEGWASSCRFIDLVVMGLWMGYGWVVEDMVLWIDVED